MEKLANMWWKQREDDGTNPGDIFTCFPQFFLLAQSFEWKREQAATQRKPKLIISVQMRGDAIKEEPYGGSYGHFIISTILK